MDGARRLPAMNATGFTPRDRADSFPGSRRYAWIVFWILFALMVVTTVLNEALGRLENFIFRWR